MLVDDNKQKAILTVGCSGSGKSTWAAEYVLANPNTVEINRDSIRHIVFARLRPDESFSWKKWSFTNENEVNEVQHKLIEQAKNKGFSIVISDTNIDQPYNRKIEKYLIGLGFDVSYMLIDVPLETCLERDAQRSDPVGEEVIRIQFKKYELLKALVRNQS